MKALRSFPVRASLPPRLARLLGLANNLRWSWDDRSADVFRWIDADLWEEAGHNPVRLLGMVPRERLAALADDSGFAAYLDMVVDELDRYLTQPRWFQDRRDTSFNVAYFSPEFGITEALPIYSGGLGVLSGDHLKAASDLGVPLVGVGLLYAQGYFRQYLNFDGWQQERYPQLDPHALPLSQVEDAGGGLLTVHVDLAGTLTALQLWKAKVGRVDLYLLDADVEGNSPEERTVTDRLYGGVIEHRLRQEIVLGIGGCSALAALALEPDLYHLNEGHAAFIALELIRRLVVDDGLSFTEAIEAARAGLVFTTHTPVPAGIDLFPRDLMEKYFSRTAEEINIPFDDLMALGQAGEPNPDTPFNMAVLALRLSGKANAVSKLHGQVSRKMFSHLWPPVPEDDAPIGSVTNGVHSRSWVGGEMQELYERYLGPDWAEAPPDEWERVREVPDEEVWRARERAREALVAYARRRLRDQLLERGSTRSEVEWTDELFDPRTLTVGFARRFAEYKRATLLLSDADRLRRLLTDQARPVQLIYAGKSHPHDDLGKELIRRIVHFGGEHDVRTRVVFLEDYDISLARQLYQGVDVWLNNPRRPLEACGTSGMKAALNGALNLSVLDGWWAEMYNGENGWAIGKAEEYTDTGYQDQVEASALYDLLERHVTPAFYDREGRVPRAWVARVKESIVSLGPQVRASRMMKDYVESMYEPVARQRRRLADGDFLRAKTLSEWKARVRQAWPHVSVKRVDSEGLPTGVVGGDVTLRVLVDLGDLTPGDVTVQLAHGVVDRNGDLISPAVEPVPASGTDGGEHLFETSFVCQSAGLYGFAVRVVPSHDDLLDPHETGLVAWAT